MNSYDIESVSQNKSNLRSKMISLRRLLLHHPSKGTICNPILWHLHLLAAAGRAPHSCSFSSLPSETTAKVGLTDEHLTNINLLIPRLCHSNQLPTALRLTTTALLANPPLKSLSLSILIDSLASQPDMTLPMSLLTHLKHTPSSHPYLRPISLMLITSYFSKHNCKHALTVFRWMERPDSPCFPDERTYGVLIHGFCRRGFVLEALVVLRAMVGANLVPSCDSKEWVYRGLLREARVKEAVELNDGLSFAGAEGMKRVLVLLEDIIAKWTE